MRRIALVLLLSAAPVAAQEITSIGPDPTAPSSLLSLGSFHNLMFQSFVVPENAVTLNSFSFWWTGFTMPDEAYFVRADIGRSATELPNGLLSDDYNLDRTVIGWYTINFMTPVTPGERLFFWFVAGNGGSYPQIPSQFAFIKLTDRDAYSDGWFQNARSDTPYPGDMLFRADFTTVTPEPMTVILLGSGLAGIGAAARRRKKQHPS